jgi:hypothetical protein
MKYKVTFLGLGWYEVEADSRKEAEEKALNAARKFHPALNDYDLQVDKVEALDGVTHWMEQPEPPKGDECNV